MKKRFVVYFRILEVFLAIALIGVGSLLLRPRLTPRFLRPRGPAYEAATRVNLQELRNLIGLFHEHYGCYPKDLNDIMGRSAPPYGTDGTKDVPIDPHKWQGPYVTTPDGELPWNPVTRGGIVGRDWLYWNSGPRVGQVRAAPGKANDGTNYSDW